MNFSNMTAVYLEINVCEISYKSDKNSRSCHVDKQSIVRQEYSKKSLQFYSPEYVLAHWHDSRVSGIVID